MNTKAEIQEFLAQKTLALVGISRDEKSFSATVNRELKAKGYTTVAVNPNTTAIDGQTCYPTLAAVPDTVGGAIVFTQPMLSEKMVKEAAAAGIRRVWLQQGAQSEAAIAAGVQAGMSLVAGKCIMMFAEPVQSIHSVHRWFTRVFGQLPR